MWRQRKARHRQQRWPGRGAFTLMELVVVVGILSLLLVILVPSIGNARRYARDVLCTTHLRQIGLAWQLYLVDSKEYFPPWQSNLQWFYGGQHPSEANKNSKSPFSLNYRPLNPYADMAIKDQAVGSGLFQCPAGRHIPGVTGTYDVYEYFGNCYMMNYSFLMKPGIPGRKGQKSFHMNFIGVPHGKLILAGDCQWYYTIHDVEWDANFHNDNDEMAVVFMDTHAAFMKLTRGESETDKYVFDPFGRSE